MPPAHALQLALRLLMRAREYSLELDRNDWDFAVDLQSLRVAGLTNNDIRWLLYQDYVVQAAEVTGPADDMRCFRPVGRLAITEESCFILTVGGVALANTLEGRPGTSNEHPRTADSCTAECPPKAIPLWNKDRRILHYNSLVVKHFKVPAPNQETILATFEEENWPSRIDDPLSPHPAINPKTRIHDTINSLNRNQKNSLIRFIGDGYGEGVCWEPADHAMSRNGREMRMIVR